MKTNSLPPNSYKIPTYIIILAMLYVTAFMSPMMLAYRMVHIGPFLLPGGTLFFVISYFLGDVIAEVYGYQLARQLVWAGLFCQLVSGLFILLVLNLPYPSYWHHEAAFQFVLGNSFRYAIASTVGNFCGEFANIFVISKLKILFKGRFFILRSIGSTFLGEGILTIVVFLITFVGETSSTHVALLILSAYLFKLLFAVFASFPAFLLMKFLKRSERIDIYDYSTNFNPFKFKIDNSTK